MACSCFSYIALRDEAPLDFVGSAESLRIFRAAGALTGGIVSSSRLSAGEGTGGT